MSSEELEAVLTLNRLTEAFALTIARMYASPTADMFEQGDAETPKITSAREYLLEAANFNLPPRIKARLSQPFEKVLSRRVVSDLQWLEADDHHLVSYFESTYPALLRQIPDPPLCLYCIGDIELLHQSQLAMVGSRKPTQSGLKIAAQFAAQLSELGLVVTSGLAYGIDAAAHKGALHHSGETIAVMGCGLDRIYPRYHERLANTIVEKGLLISEYPLGTGAFARNFPQRNRIVTGLSFGTLVVEAAIKSGSLISARLAMEYGREVFAVPGSIYSAASAGCHQLIQNGAKLVQGVGDIVEEMSVAVMSQDLQRRKQLSEPEREVLSHLSGQSVTIDELCELTSIPISELSSLLIKLEIEVYVMSQGMGYVLCAPDL